MSDKNIIDIELTGLFRYDEGKISVDGIDLDVMLRRIDRQKVSIKISNKDGDEE